LERIVTSIHHWRFCDRLHQSRREDQEGTVQARNRGGRTATMPEIWRAALAAQAQLPKIERQNEPIQVLL
jgi:hypothetical protein